MANNVSADAKEATSQFESPANSTADDIAVCSVGPMAINVSDAKEATKEFESPANPTSNFPPKDVKDSPAAITGNLPAVKADGHPAKTGEDLPAETDDDSIASFDSTADTVLLPPPTTIPEVKPKVKGLTKLKKIPRFELRDFLRYQKLLSRGYDSTCCQSYFELTCSLSVENVQRWLWTHLQKLRRKSGYSYINPVATIIRPNPTPPHIPKYLIYVPDEPTAVQLLQYAQRTAQDYGIVDLVTSAVQTNPHYVDNAQDTN